MRAAEAARTPCGVFAAGSALGAVLFLWLAFSVWSGSGSFAQTLPAAVPGVALAVCAVVQAVRYSNQDDLAREAFGRFAARTVLRFAARGVLRFAARGEVNLNIACHLEKFWASPLDAQAPRVGTNVGNHLFKLPREK